MLKCGLEGAISIRYYDVIRDVARDFQKVALGHVYCGASYVVFISLLYTGIYPIITHSSIIKKKAWYGKPVCMALVSHKIAHLGKKSECKIPACFRLDVRDRRQCKTRA